MTPRLLAPAVFAWLGLALGSTGCRRDEHIAHVYEPASPTSTPAPPVSTTSAASSGPAAVPVASDGGTGGCVPSGIGRDITVGPGQTYASLGDAPFESLARGDTVRIFWRPEPYHEKLMISGIGTEYAPIVVCGVPGPDGQLPVIDGQDATTRPALDFPFDGHQVRGLVIIGHRHSEPYENTPSYIVLQGLEIRNASPPNSFTDRSGKKLPYSNIAAGLFVERASHLIIRGCTVTANNTGMFIGTGGGAVALTRDVLIEKNYIHDNGSLADYYEHNVYNEASNVTYQFNRFGPPRGGAKGILGANIKERSAGVVIRYNWIEDGAHIMDIVDAQESKDETRSMPSFHSTYVYGNVIIRGTTPAGSMIHYGGDSEVYADYRKGTLFFYDNTVVVKNQSYPPYTRTPVFELSTNDEHLDSRNNIYFSTVVPDDTHAVGMLGGRDGVSSGVATFAGDWVKKGWTQYDLTLGLKAELRAQVHGLDKVTRGDLPGFRDASADDYAFVARGSAGTAVALTPDIPLQLLPTFEYVEHQQGKKRPEALTVGAFGD